MFFLNVVHDEMLRKFWF